jgi:hypothetical protein
MTDDPATARRERILAGHLTFPVLISSRTNAGAFQHWKVNR